MTALTNRTTTFSGTLVLFMSLILLSSASMAQFASDPNIERKDVPDQYKWNATHIFADDAVWEAEFAAFRADLAKFSSFQGRLGSSADMLFDCLEMAQVANDRINRLESYTSLFLDVDQGDAKAQAKAGRVNALYPELNQTTAFIEPEILKIDQGTIDRFLAEHDGLKVYDYYFRELLRQKDHTLGPDEERIMALSGLVRGGYRNMFFALFGVDMNYHDMVNERGETVTLSLPGFVGYRASPVYNVRRQAAREFFGTLKDYENVLASSLDGHVQGHVMTKEARGYDSCLAASLDPDAISPEAYRMLIRTINENLPRTLHRYVDLRRKVLGLEGPLTFSNLYNPMIDDVEMVITYDEARDLLVKALEPLGDEYLGYLREGLSPDSGWVDIYPNLGKQGGAYSNGSLARDLHPYIKMNFDNSLDNTSTLIHEFGHSIHSIYARRTQPPIYGDYTSFLAEIASTCNEELLLSYLLKKADDTDTRLMLLNSRLENIRLSIMRQTLFAEFELRFHEHAEAGNPLTADYLNTLYSELVTTYYGPNFQMQENEEVEWGFISQFWRNFYVFTYATGMTSGISLAEQINDQGRKAADRYIDEMLKAGASAPPLEILSRAGVNLETAEPVIDMLDLFEETLNEFDKTWTKKYGKS